MARVQRRKKQVDDRCYSTLSYQLFEVYQRKGAKQFMYQYNSQNSFVFHREENSLWHNLSDLVGNFRIDWEESERILKGGVKIRDEFQSVTGCI